MIEIKKHINLIVLSILFTITTFSQEANTLFVEGNKLYKTEQYSEAIKTYLQIEKLNKQSVDLYYNLANAYYKTNQVAPAIYYYEKALQLAPNNKDVLLNLDFANRMTIDNIEALPTTLFQKLSKNYIQKLNYNSWAYTAIFFAFLFAFLFLIYHFSDSSGKKRMYFITGTFSFIFVLLSLLAAFHTYEVNSFKKEAILFVQQTEVKNAPSLSSDVVFELHEGAKVTILESKDNWKKIKIANGQIGWIISSESWEL